MKKTICMVLTLIMLLPILAGCGNGTNQVGLQNIIDTVAADAQTVIGSVEKDGIEITIPESTFDGATKVSVKAADIKAESGATLLSPVYEIAEENDTHALGADVTVRIKLPEGTSIDDCINLMGAYYDGETWEYIEPDFKELADGFITFSTPHFSPFAAVSLEDKKAMEQYAKRMAAQQNTIEPEKTGYYEEMKSILSETLDKMQLTDEYAQGVIIEAVFKESDFGTFIVAAKNGNVGDYGGKMSEMIASAITKNMWNEEFTSKINSAIGSVTSGVIAGAEKIYDGEYAEAYKAFVSSAAEYFPSVRAVKAVVAACEAGSEMWQQYSFEYAYKNVYLNNTSIGADGSLNGNDDWEFVFHNMGDGLSRMQQSYREAYASTNEMSVSDIENDTALKNKLDAAVRESVKHQFMHRYTSKAKLDKAEEAIMKQLEAFDKYGLLTHDTLLNGFSYDMTMSERLNSLYKIRQNIIDIAGGDVSVFGQNTEMQEETLAYAITEWFHCGTANRGDFYKWMEKEGFIKKPVKQEKYAWVLTGTEDYIIEHSSGSAWSYEQSMSNGDYSETATYTDRYCGLCDAPGGHVSTFSCTVSEPPEIMYADQVVSLTASLKGTASACNMGSNHLNCYAYFGDSSSARFTDADGNTSAKTSNETPSLSVTVSYTIPAGRTEGAETKITVYSGLGRTRYFYVWQKVS